MNIRITKAFDFEAAHALDGYDGKCKDIHGHSYHLEVTFIGEPKRDKKLSDCGMVVDFGEIKKIVQEKILPNFDHRLVLRKDSRFQHIAPINERIRMVDYQPTCENMLVEIVEELKKLSPQGISLIKAHLRETSKSYAEWFAQDND